MAKEAYPFILPLALISLLLALFGVTLLAVAFLGLAVFVGFFFRDPDRAIPNETAAIVSPADGKIVGISTQPDGTKRISIFLSVFDVHINRSPVAGEVESVEYRQGRFHAAFHERASVENEQNVLVIGNGSDKIKVSQIAGILARRVVCWKQAGDYVQRGERIGLIKFGSRVDVFLPGNVRNVVSRGDRVRGGSTIIGRYQHD